MAVNTKAVKTRIGSIKNTRKITRAMQMIAAVKMRKAVNSAVNARVYEQLGSELVNHISGDIKNHILSSNKSGSKVLLVIITSNRGLCGNYNSAVLKEATRIVQNSNKQFSVIAVGKKSAAFARRKNLELLSIYEKLTDNPEFTTILPITHTVIDSFKKGEFSEVRIVFTNYISGLLQKVESKVVLPVGQSEIVDLLTDEQILDIEDRDDDEDDDISEYEFEPDRDKLLDYILPRIVEVQFFQALLESTASEHSSRMLAMKNATEAAGDMIDDLTLEYNKGRQAAITQEIAEITGGANALTN